MCRAKSILLKEEKNRLGSGAAPALSRSPGAPCCRLSSHYRQSAGSDWLAAVSEVTRPEQRQSPGGGGGVVAAGKVSPREKHNYISAVFPPSHLLSVRRRCLSAELQSSLADTGS